MKNMKSMKKMKNKKLSVLALTKETPEARRQRASSGIKFRAVVLPHKKKRARDQYIYDEETI